MDEVELATNGVCNEVYKAWVVTNKNQNRSIEVNVEIEFEILGSLRTDEYQVLLAPGGSRRLTCSGSSTYTARARKLGAEYR
jgi:subtilisin-like proprotein convertase family protein